MVVLVFILLFNLVHCFSPFTQEHSISFIVPNQRIMATDTIIGSTTVTVDEQTTVPSFPPVKILHSGLYHLIVEKPPSVVCHHSGWVGLRSRRKDKKDEIAEIPMLQRVRDTVGRRVNLVHRLDRGASGALILTYAENDEESFSEEEEERDFLENVDAIRKKKGPTASFSQALASTEAQKTYVALVRGEGIFHGEDFKTMGWFPVSRPIRDANGVLKDATTMIRFVAGQGQEDESDFNPDTNSRMDRPRLSLVLARPQQGRWHQIRRHLNGLSHPILGDSSHGSSRLNREWRDKRGLSYERTCLHLARIQLPPVDPYSTTGLDISCPLAQDMRELLETYAPDVFEEAKPILRQEGVIW